MGLRVWLKFETHRRSILDLWKAREHCQAAPTGRRWACRYKRSNNSRVMIALATCWGGKNWRHGFKNSSVSTPRMEQMEQRHVPCHRISFWKMYAILCYYVSHAITLEVAIHVWCVIQNAHCNSHSTKWQAFHQPEEAGKPSHRTSFRHMIPVIKRHLPKAWQQGLSGNVTTNVLLNPEIFHELSWLRAL